MAQASIELQPDLPPEQPNRLAGLKRLIRLQTSLRPLTSWAIALVLMAPIAHYFWHHEGWWANMTFTFAVTLAIGSVLVAVSRRVLFSTVLVALMLIIIVAASTVKQKMMDMVVHAYDVIFYFTSWSTLTYLWSDHRQHLIALLAGIAVSVLLALAAFRLDGTRIKPIPAIAAALVFALVGFFAAEQKGERRHTQFFWDDLFVSSFYASWSETIEMLLRGGLIEAASGPHKGALFSMPKGCTLAAKPPHIILIHQESVVQPSLFASLGYDKSLDRFFQSHDGKLHPMRVETYGGASWLTEFSILAGVSTHSFGGLRQFVQSLFAGKIRDTVPETLARCGYRNVMFYPMLRSFVSSGKFYAAIGIPEIFDSKDQGAKSYNERDRFYYDSALKEMSHHLRTSGRPLFSYILTMAAHSPYDVPYMPEVDVPGGASGTHPEMNEYLRRVGMARMDHDYLRAELKRRFPNERFLIVHYGDHHPIATRMTLGFAESLDPEDMTMSLDSPGFITYYAIDGQNFQPPPLPDVDVLDVPYLGGVILEAAGLPLSDSFRERQRLRAVCAGRYYGCSRRDEILVFHRRLIDSGLIDSR